MIERCNRKETLVKAIGRFNRFGQCRPSSPITAQARLYNATITPVAFFAGRNRSGGTRPAAASVPSPRSSRTPRAYRLGIPSGGFSRPAAPPTRRRPRAILSLLRRASLLLTFLLRLRSLLRPTPALLDPFSTSTVTRQSPQATARNSHCPQSISMTLRSSHQWTRLTLGVATDISGPPPRRRPAARRPGGPAARRPSGTAARRHGGTAAQRHSGPAAQRHSGTAAQRSLSNSMRHQAAGFV